MTRTIDAVFVDGVLRPMEPLPLADHQRVRVTVVATDAPSAPARDEAVRRFLEGTGKTRLRTNGRLPTRDELHDRR